MRIYKLPGVGHKTRPELGELFKQLRDRLPTVEMSEPAPLDEDGISVTESVDSVARQVADQKRGGKVTEEHEIVRAFLEWQPPRKAPMAAWPSQSELAIANDVTRQRISQAITAARKQWSRFPFVDSTRNGHWRWRKGRSSARLVARSRSKRSAKACPRATRRPSLT